MKNSSKGFVSSGVLALIGALVVVGFLGWYLLGESQKVNDEYDAADQANSSILPKSESSNEATEDESSAEGGILDGASEDLPTDDSQN